MRVDEMAAAAAAAEAAQRNMIPPQPAPMIVDITQGTDDRGEHLALVSISHPMGVTVLFFDAKLARQVGAELQKIGSAGALTIASDTPKG